MANRLRLLLVGIGGFIVIAIFTFPVWQPVLLREAIVENVPGLPEDLQPVFRQLPSEQQAAYRQMAEQNADMAAQMLQAAVSPDTVVPEAAQVMPQMTNEVVISEGEFKPADNLRQIAGTYKLYQLPDNRRILRLEKFRVTNGPDLHVVLSRSLSPKTGADTGSDYVDLGLLQGNVGNQNYAVPADIDVEAYQSIVIFNISFTTVFGSAPLVIQ